MAALVAGCGDNDRQNARHYVPLTSELLSLMNQKGMSKHDPILIRSYKKEAEIEVWKRTASGQYALLKTYPICRWSGQLGPKHREGDRQAPEGFYHISARHMNPNSSFHLSFDMGYPNAYDRAHGRTGSFLMVHGACSSRGCYSMTDNQIEEIYALVREAHSGGQGSVQMQAMPFRMNAENLAKHRFDKNMAFWKMLKEGADHFDVTRKEPKVAVCGGRYTFNRDGDCNGDIAPEIKTAVARKADDDQRKVDELVAKGTPAVRITYADGGQHSFFRNTTLAYAGGSGIEERATAAPPMTPRPGALAFADVSRPEALETGPSEIAIGPDGKPVKQTAKPVVMAAPAPAKPAVEPAAKPVLAAPSATTAVKTEQPATAEQPFYQRIFSAFGGGGGAKPEENVVAPDLPKTAPLPRPRVSQEKPAAKAKNPLKTSALPPIIRGAQPAIPPGIMAYAPTAQ